ncbi:MAG: ArgR family transcriptional regulator, partial [Oscillospiraceae bacterium]|nr:ArgR family transcriptional regulator [Oscillospiraceae bacterium]
MKKQRQSKIIEIIESHEVSTQEALKQYLEDSGIHVTQATLSRDINELRIRKQMSASGAYIYVRTKGADIEYPPIFRDSVVDVVYACNTVVIKCHIGMAQAVCAALDTAHRAEIVGTLAG